MTHVQHEAPHSPSYLDKVNTIVDFFEDDCVPPWTVYVETALPAAGEAVLQLVTPSLTDVIRAYFRPKGLRFGGHIRKIRRRRGKRWLPEDTSELIGKHIPGYEEHRARRVTNGVKFMWEIDGVLQRLFWYWLVADVSLDFFYNWTSAIMRSDVCATDYAGRGFGVTNRFLNSFPDWRPWGGFTATHQSGVCYLKSDGATWHTTLGDLQVVSRCLTEVGCSNGNGYCKFWQPNEISVVGVFWVDNVYGISHGTDTNQFGIKLNDELVWEGEPFSSTNRQNIGTIFEGLLRFGGSKPIQQ